MGGGRPKYPRTHVQDKMASNLDQLAQFEEFKQQILPSLRESLRKGESAEQIYKKAQSLAAARAVSIAATSMDETKALAAIKDILDRSGGKATENKTVTHKYANLSDSELDAMLISEGEETDELEETAQEELQ